MELRYNSKLMRLMTSLTYLISMLLFVCVTLSTPSKVVNSITALPTFSIILLLGILGTCYALMVRLSFNRHCCDMLRKV